MYMGKFAKFLHFARNLLFSGEIEEVEGENYNDDNTARKHTSNLINH